MTYHTTTLANGLRVIHEPSASEVTYCGYVVCAGTRHEDVPDAGMAHFIEHMSFKGTTRRRACHISNGLERVGGDLNAFTNKQETVYHATVLREDFRRAADFLTDIVFGSTYPQHEIDKEVEVICDEIDSYRDSPAELIFDEFEAMLYAGHPLGRDILGTPERLREYTTTDARRFADRHYRPANAVFFVYGNVDFSLVVRTLERQFSLVEKNFNGISEKSDKAEVFSLHSPTAGERLRVVEKDTHQAHVLIGAPTFGGTDNRRFALMLLNNMLGGPGGNSRLNMSLRERAGLVYSVDAYLSTYPDTGYWNVYFGCDAHDIARCRRIVERELRRLTDAPLSAAQLAAAKKQLCGQVGISRDSREGYALAMGKVFAHYGVHRNVEELLESIRSITAAEVQETAAEVYHPDRLRTLIYR